MASTVTTVQDMAEEFLAACETALATTTGGVPDRSFVAPAIPALDCNQLTVHAQTVGLQQGPQPVTPVPVGGFQANLNFPNIVTYQAMITRCTPQPTGLAQPAPSTAALHATAALLNEDVWAIWNHLKRELNAGNMFQGACSGVYLDPAQPIVDQGALGGWVIQIRVVVEGYQP